MKPINDCNVQHQSRKRSNSEERDTELKEPKDNGMRTPETRKIETIIKSTLEESPTYDFINDLSPIQPVKSKDDLHMFWSPSFASIASDFCSPGASRFFTRHLNSLQRDICSDNLDGNSEPIAPEMEISSPNKAINETPEKNLSELTQYFQFECSTKTFSALKFEQNIGSNASQAEVEIQNEYHRVTPNKEQERPHVTNRLKDLGKEEERDRFCDSNVIMLPNPLVHNGVPEEHAIDHSPQIPYNYNKAEKSNISISTDGKVSKDYNEAEKPNISISTDCRLKNLGKEEERDEFRDSNVIMLPTFNPLVHNGVLEEHVIDHHTPQIPYHCNEAEECNISISTSCRVSKDYNEAEKPNINISADCRLKNLGKEEERDGFRDRDVIMLPTFNPLVHNGVLEEHAIDHHTPQIPYHYNEAEEPNINISTDCKVSKNTQAETQHRRRRRRCLSFDNKASIKKSKFGITNTKSIIVPQGSSLPPYMAPCIEKHLNTPAISQEFLLFTDPDWSMIAGNIPIIELLNAEQDNLPTCTEAQDINIDTFEAPAFGIGKKSSQCSPKKIWTKENSGKSEGCRRCNCKKSLCLKLYCECFAAGVYCVEPCSCHECSNTSIHKEKVEAARKQIVSRNPLAFAPKFISSLETTGNMMMEEANKIHASTRHKNGCNCKKSTCRKKYCECYQGGVGCSLSCRCDGCENVFGRKCAKGTVDEAFGVGENQHGNILKDKQNTIVKEHEDRSLENIIPLTPLESSRKQPCSSTPSRTPSKRELPLQSNIAEQFDSFKENVFIPLDENIYSLEEDKDYSIFWEEKSNYLEEKNVHDIYNGESSSMHVVKNKSPNGKRASHSCRSIQLSPILEVEDVPPLQPSLNNDLTNENIMHHSFFR